jgi:uncharacterized protein (DUF697 family)
MALQQVSSEHLPSDEELNALILRWSVLAGVADITPVPGADIAAVATCQLTMFFDMARKYGGVRNKGKI